MNEWEAIKLIMDRLRKIEKEIEDLKTQVNAIDERTENCK